jgi:hypothetical protein
MIVRNQDSNYRLVRSSARTRVRWTFCRLHACTILTDSTESIREERRDRRWFPKQSKVTELSLRLRSGRCRRLCEEGPRA